MAWAGGGGGFSCVRFVDWAWGLRPVNCSREWEVGLGGSFIAYSQSYLRVEWSVGRSRSPFGAEGAEWHG